MTRRWLLALIAANLVGLLSLVFIYPHLMVSPGPVIAAHAELNQDCFACHTAWRGATPERCIACHALPDIGVRTRNGLPLAQHERKTPFHQQLIEPNCMACHSDHTPAKLTRRSHKPFSHALLRPETRTRCATCHIAPPDNFHRQIKGNCGQCHQSDKWKPATFDHSRYFVLDDDHNVGCASCHTDHDYSRYTCYGCHEHRPAKIRAEHLEEGIRDFENCVECHRSADDEPRRGKRRGRQQSD